MNSKNKKIYSLCAQLLCISMVFTGCGSETPVDEEIIKPVQILQSVYGSQENSLSLSGNILPGETVKLAFKNPGVITQADFTEGDFVKAGQKMASIDTKEYNLQVQASASDYESSKMQIESEIPARISQAKAQLDLTKVTYERIASLYEAGGATKAQLDEITAKKIADENTYKLAMEAEALAKSRLEKAQAGLELSQTKLSDTTINSPIDGIVMKKLVEEGEVTGAGYPVVAVGRVNVVDAEIGVSDKDIQDIEIGETVKVYLYGLNKVFNGVVHEIGPTADPATRTFAVKVAIQNPNFEIRPGMVAKVKIPISSTQGIQVPLSSVITKSDGQMVFVYDEQTGTVKKQLVQTGKIVKDQIEIISGLKDKDNVVIQGQFRLHNGDSVKVEGANND
ncbi:MAG: efflux RND transporter periplasmic adaptor subunit [Proteocatella sp.]